MSKRYGRNQKRKHLKEMETFKQEFKNFILSDPIRNVLMSMTINDVKHITPVLADEICDYVKESIINEILF